MPRTPEENERIKEERKEQILMAGLAVFAENGLAAAKMSDIARAAGVSYGLVYNYFPSKEQMFVELLNKRITLSHEFVTEIKNMQLPPLERIKEIFIRLFNYYSSDPQGELYFRIMMQLNFYPHLWEKSHQKDLSSDPVFQLLLETIKEGQKRGEFINKNLNEMVLLLGYIAVSFSFRGHEMFDDKFRVENLVDLIIRMIKK